MEPMPASPSTAVFIVDDSPAIRVRLVALLEGIDGMRVAGEADCARDAIARIRVLRPDCVLLDLNLLGRSGLEVLRTIHPESPDIAFVVLTNHAEPQYRDACMRAGATHFLDKSQDLERLPHVLSGIARQQ
jgi:DNA-binding NarL/FixJ family response regulator